MSEQFTTTLPGLKIKENPRHHWHWACGFVGHKFFLIWREHGVSDRYVANESMTICCARCGQIRKEEV